MLTKRPYFTIIRINKDLNEDAVNNSCTNGKQRCDPYFCCFSGTTNQSDRADTDTCASSYSFEPFRWSSASNASKDASLFVGEDFDKIRAQEGDDLVKSLRVPLLIGAFIGLIPIRGLRDKFNSYGSKRPKFTWLHFRTFISLVVTFGLLLHTIFVCHNFLIELTSRRNSAGTLVLTFSGVWFYSAGTLVYVFFLARSKHLCQYFETWSKTSFQVSNCLIPDTKVRRDVNLITAFFLLDCLGENILYHFHAMKIDRNKIGSLSFGEFLKDYYNSNEYIFPFFKYSPTVSVILLITNKLANYAWNFGDIILILISRVLYGRYLALNSFLETQMESEGCILMIRKGVVSWGSIRKKYLLLTGLLQEGNRIFAPLIWLSYITDMFFVCRQLYEGLAHGPSQKQAIDKIYMIWSLLHLIMRTLGVNMMATFISEEAHRISKILQHVRPDEYTAEVQRLERFLASRIIGITGSGCFVITRSFVLMIISAIFTLEVVLLQNAHLTVG